MKKDSFLNLTRIVESNAKIYWAIIFGIACCLLLYIAEVVHMQLLAESLKADSAVLSGKVFALIAQRYTWARYGAIAIFVLWSIYEYQKTKKKLAL